METTDYQTQAADVIARLTEKNRLGDAITARNQNDYGGLSYYIARALGLDFQATVKFGLIFAVVDLIDAM